MAQVKELTDISDWKQLKDDSADRPVLVLKHSTRCPVSAEAYDEFMKFAGRESAAPVDLALVLVVESRPVSNTMAEELGVKHESPQALLIDKGQAVWHASHWRITEETLREQASRFV